MIEIERFICSSQTRVRWLAARKRGVSATMVANASTAAGFTATVQALGVTDPIIPNDAMLWGVAREPHIAHVVKERFNVLPNDWLISAKGEPWQIATPDGISLDHTVIGEYKTSGKSLDKIPLRYMRQMQWQLYVTGANRCVFGWEQRVETEQGYVPGFTVSTQIVERDEKMIADLLDVAHRLKVEIDKLN